MSESPTRDVHSELVVGLVSTTGTELTEVVKLLRERFLRTGYLVHVLKISEQVIPLLEETPDFGKDQFKRLSDLMTAGNTARKRANNNAVLAYGVAALINERRPKNKNGQTEPCIQTVFIIDSLKRPEEVEELRHIYPNGFVLVGVHSEEERRIQHLVNDRGITQENALKLIERDREESHHPYGQRVNKTFHLADFFVRISMNHDTLRCDIQRMVDIWFGDPFKTPTFDEYAMFLAFAAALRSADLSRQVGAVITRDRQILATGANDCPAFGGGLYWPERGNGTCFTDQENGRDYCRGFDSNRKAQIEMIESIVTAGIQKGIDEVQLKEVLEASSIRDLTEFGRVVHAEMEALLACGRSNISTSNATLFCTTFPCHNCAKHIVAAGIKRVVFIEPYTKSKALEFHNDSITTDPDARDESKVKFVPFVGIGPRRFFDSFSMNLGSGYNLVRKDDYSGEKKNWRIDDAKLRIKMLPNSYLDFELEACRKFEVVWNDRKMGV